MIRHGQYLHGGDSDADRVLTEKGRQQALPSPRARLRILILILILILIRETGS